jgi:hypothetical protein
MKVKIFIIFLSSFISLCLKVLMILCRRHTQRHKMFVTSSCAKCGWRPEQVVDPELSLLEHLHGCQSPEQLQAFLAMATEDDRLEEELETLMKSYSEASQNCDQRQEVVKLFAYHCRHRNILNYFTE